MNNLAILPQVAMYGLQLQNVKRDVVKKVNLSDIKLNSSTTEIETLPPQKDEPVSDESKPVENEILMAANEVSQTSFI